MTISNSISNQALTTTSSPTFNALSVTTSTVTGNAIANNFAPATSIIVLLGGTSTFTNTTSQIVVLGGSGGTIILPDATTLTVGWQYFIHNNTSGNVTIETNGGATLTVMASGAYINLTNVTIIAPAGTWAFSFDLPQNVLWGTSLLSATSTAASFASLTLATPLTPANGGSLAWVAAPSTPVTIAVNTGYIVTDASQVVFTLPTTAAIGSVARIAGLGAGGWQLLPGAGQTIQTAVGSASTSITSAEAADAIEVVCTVANTTWLVLSSSSTGLVIV